MKALHFLAAVMLLAVAGSAQAATLTLSPSSQAVTAGDTFTVNILLDTQSAAVDAVDVFF